jgi:hypothetical protein
MRMVVVNKMKKNPSSRNSINQVRGSLQRPREYEE